MERKLLLPGTLWVLPSCSKAVSRERRLSQCQKRSFVRDLVAPFYAAGGRPSVDPVLFFKLQLVMFFEGIRSEGQLVRTAAGGLSARWYSPEGTRLRPARKLT